MGRVSPAGRGRHPDESVPVSEGDGMRLLDELCARVRAAGHGPASDPVPTLVDRHLDTVAPLLGAGPRNVLRDRALARLVGLGALEPFLADPAVTEVVVNAGRYVWVDRGGVMQHVATLAAGEADTLVERIIGPLGLRFDRTAPVVDARLPDGARLCAVAAPLAVDGTCVSIRRFALREVVIESFATGAVAGLLRELVARRCNVVVSGATSSGKTTMLNALAGEIDPGERIITIEDTAELRLRAEHVVRLEARRATPDGTGEVTVRDLVRAALRLRPDRLVVGEVRGAEAYDMVQALNTGHDGSLSTVHANGPADALRRLCALAAQGAPVQSGAAIAEQVRSSIDVIVHLGRFAGGQRRVVEVAEVPGPGDRSGVTLLARHDRVLGQLTRTRTVGAGAPHAGSSGAAS